MACPTTSEIRFVSGTTSNIQDQLDNKIDQEALTDTATVDFTYDSDIPELRASVRDNCITYAKMQDMNTNKLLGRSTAGTGDIEELSVGTGLTLSSGTLTANGLADADYGDVVVSGSGTTWTVDNNVISDSKLRDSVSLSVMGRSTNSTGDPGDIVASNDGEVLRRSGTSIGFGTIATAGIANDAVTYAKIQNVSNGKLLGRSTSGSGDVEELSVGTGLTLSSGTLDSVLNVAWSTYTPTWTGASTNPVINNGTLTGAYLVVGKTMFLRITIIMGSTTTYGSGDWSLALPGGYAFKSSVLQTIPILAQDVGTAYRHGLAHIDTTVSTTTFRITINGGVRWNSTSPHTWAVGDTIMANAVIEID